MTDQGLVDGVTKNWHTNGESIPALAVKGVSKRFGGSLALADVDLDIRRGEVHCLIGENGAGKSTLVKIMAGAVRPDSGHIELEGNVVNFRSPHQALGHGLAFVFQELGAVPGMTVAQNVCLGKEPLRSSKVLDKARMSLESKEVLARIGFQRIKPDTPMGLLSVGDQQAVMIARGLWLNAKIIVMDEPTAALGRHEVDQLFGVIRQLVGTGHGVLFISHKLEELREIGDRVSVFRNGQKVDEMLSIDANDTRLLTSMTGKEASPNPFAGRSASEGSPKDSPVVLESKGITTDKVSSISLSVHAGEILGVGGLVGSGRTELLKAILGIDKVIDGSVWIDGNEAHFRGTRDALRVGLVLVPEDRRLNGLLPNRSVGQNLLLGYEQLRRSDRPKGAAQKLAADQVSMLQIRPPDLERPVVQLSGGNQQKTILGRWLLCNPRVLLLDEPTRGVDVGAREEIYRILRRLASEGMAILMVTSDLRELVQVSDRIVVMRGGRIVGELGSGADENAVLALAFDDSLLESVDDQNAN